MVYAKVFTACSKDKSEEEIPFYKLRERAIKKLNEQISEKDQIITIKEEIGSCTRYPMMSNSGTWYNERWLSLTVFFI